MGDNRVRSEHIGSEWRSAKADPGDLSLPLELEETVPVNVSMCEICTGLAVNPARVRCDIVICDVRLYHYDTQCMCTARAAALTAPLSTFHGTTEPPPPPPPRELGPSASAEVERGEGTARVRSKSKN